MTIVVQVDTKTLEQVTKQLNKLVNVIKILEHEPGEAVERELMLVKVKGEGEARARILEICDVFRVRVLDVTHRTITIEGTGTPDKLEALLELLARLRDRGALAHGADRARPWGPRDQGTRRAAADGRRQRAGVDRRRRLTNAPDRHGTGKAWTSPMATIYHDADADPSVLAGQRIAVLGFGSQGHAHAQNLKDSGHDVRVGLREGSALLVQGPRRRDSRCGRRADAVAEADVIMVVLPDTAHGAVYTSEIAPNLKAGDMLMFAHGFSVHFGTVKPPSDVDVTMIAPKGPGHLVRRTYEEGIGTPALVAVQQDATGTALQRARSPTARGSEPLGRASSRPRSRRRPRPTCSGSSRCCAAGSPRSSRPGFDTLVQAGYQPEIAYFECLHELKLIVDLIYEGGCRGCATRSRTRPSGATT